MIYTDGVTHPDVPIALWDSVFTKGSYTQTNTTGFNALSQATNTHWLAASPPDNLTVTLDSPTYANALGIASHNLGSTNSVIEVRADDVPIASFTPTDDSTILFLFPRTLATTNFWVRVSSSDSTPSIGYFCLGETIRFESGILPSYTPMFMSDSYELLGSQSRNGQFLGNRIIRTGGQTSFGMNILEREFIEGSAFQGFRDWHNQGNAYFFASNPFNLPQDTGYVWRTDGGGLNPTFTSSSPFYEMNFDLEVYI